MQFLKLDKTKDPRYSYDSYEYVTGNEGPAVEFSINYNKGGTNFLSGDRRPRGLFVTITPVVYEKREGSNGEVYTSRVYTLGIGSSQSGGYLVLEDLPRFNAKKLLAAAEFFDQETPVIANKWLTNRSEAYQLLTDQVEAFKKQLIAKAA